MPKIPLSQIPNAPQAGSPVLAPTLPGVAPLQPINLGGGFDGSGLARTAQLLDRGSDSISRGNSLRASATANNKQNLIDDRPFTAEARAMEFVGGAIAHAGQVATNFAFDMLEAKEEMDRLDVHNILTNTRDQQEQENLENINSPQNWVPSYLKKQPDVQKQIDALNISPSIRGRIDADVAQFWAESSNRFALSASKASIGQAIEKTESTVMRETDAGNIENAYAIINGSKLISEIRKEELRTVVEKKNQQNVQLIATQADPVAMSNAINDAIKTKTPVPEMPWLDPTKNMADLIKAKSLSDQLAGDQKNNALQNGIEAIDSGEFTTSEQVEEFGRSNDLDSQDIQALQKSMELTVSASPAGQAKYQQNVSQVQSAVFGYDPKTDKYGEKFREIMGQISSTTEGEDRLFYRNQLASIRSEGRKPNAQVKSGLISLVDQWHSQGILFNEGLKDGKPIKGQEEAAMKSGADLVELKGWVSELMDKNPELTTKDALERINDRVGPKLIGSTAQKAMEQSKSDRSWLESTLRFVNPFLGRAIDAMGENPSNEQIEEATKGQPIMKPTSDASSDTARTIVNYEARRGKDGKVKVYNLPSGDGGGKYEVAGINDRYHPVEAAKLKRLVEAGKADEAEAEAAKYIANYTAPVAENATNSGVKFALQDTAFNRGPAGATKILQHALGVTVDGKLSPKTKAALAEAEKDPKSLLAEFRKSREWYEREIVGRDESSKFFKGLTNRWNDQYRDAVAMA